ncbi:MAG: O-antigen ligase family protein [Candidatus Omnitrophica bacterium]|nr:O-antigen ligase family protein [Candidatus Omnitrophota bacterium]
MSDDILQKIIKRIILVLVGFFCYFYALYASDFAELHIQFAGLDFPIFIGEILLGVCVLLFLIYILKFSVCFNLRFVWLGTLYVSWVLAKAFLGYVHWGPLALRNAALFYYPFFALIGYMIFERSLYQGLGRWFLLGFLLWNLLFVNINDYFVIAFLMLAFGLSWHLRQQVLRFAGIFLCAFYVIHSRVMWWGCRSHMVGIGVMAIFLAGYFLFGMFKAQRRVKLLTLFVLVVIFVGFLFKFGDHNALKSMMTFRQLVKEYKKLDVDVRKNETTYIHEPLIVRLYNENSKTLPLFTNKNSKNQSLFLDKPREEVEKHSLPEIKMIAEPSQVPVEPAVQSDSSPSHERRLDVAYANICFRLFVWKDMVDDFIKQKAWGGVSFGQPQRSPSLEAAHWATADWLRDGWITPHNSFLHMIYRGGLVGFVCVVMIFGLLVNMTRRFLKLRSVWGGLLVGCLVYWVTISNFLVFLEFPYNAIPFWTFWGMTLAYLHTLEKDSLCA